MTLVERLQLTRAETFYAVVLPLLGSATVVSIILCIRTAPRPWTWSGSLINVVMFVSLEVYLIKVLRTPGDKRPAISNAAAVEMAVGSASVVVLSLCAIVAAIWSFNGNERTINDAITSLIGPVLIWILFGLTVMHRSRLKRPNEAG